ncbi:MAG: hypothetical protein MMC33_006498 [Icmadophila ericetorum]|nr:hypothetical protein [Icmadophila ericetorum]
MDKLARSPRRNPSNASSFSRFRLPLRSHTEILTEEGSEVKGNLGLNLLHQPSETLIELIFVHGLGGGSRKTWSFSNLLDHFWPQTWLPHDKDFRNVRINSYGYDSDWTSTKDDISNVSDFASGLLNALFYSPTLRKPMDTPIVFFAHSMGGLVVKKTLLLAQQDQTYASIASRIRTMVFLATPHRGADSAPKINNLLSISFAHSKKAYIDDLTRNSGALQTINDEFRHIADRLNLFSFYETLKTNVGGTNILIVDRGSAILDYKHERHMPVQANHRGICKFESITDPNYIIVRNVLAAMIHDLEKDFGEIKHDQWREQRGKLKMYLGMIETPEDDLESLQDCRSYGSCEWIASDPSFQCWRDETLSENAQYFWLTAKPATGKSVLASYVVGHLEDDLNQDVSYFFFTRGHRFKSWLSVCLRSLAYQMALKSSEVRDIILNLQDEDISFDKEDPRSIWRKLFVQGILRGAFQRPFYWVIDALDECNEPTVFINLLTKASSATMLRIFVTSRSSGEISAGFNTLNVDVKSIDMTIDRTLSDIESYVIVQVAKLRIEGKAIRQEIIERIMEKSAGCFLWVKLVLEKLQRVHTARAIQKVLDEIPADMDQLYKNTLQHMSENREEHDFIKAILTWAVCSTRPLTVDELREALKLDIEDDMTDLKHSIAVCCGQLVYVDCLDRVQLVHETARKFLLAVSESDLAVSRAEGNRRLLSTCLKFLSGPEMDRRHRMGRTISNSKISKQPHRILALYASSALPEHLKIASAAHEPILGELAKFLRSNVLTWVEFVASKLKSLHHLMRLARSMKGFLERRAKYVPPFSEDVDLVQAWTIDLIRLVTKFGRTILESPLAIYSQVPPFCPRGTAIYRQFGLQNRGLEVSGLLSSDWDDRISCLAFRPDKTLAVACGEAYFAVGVLNTIVMYYKMSCQEHIKLGHGEDVHLLCFNTTGEILASSGVRIIRLFNAVTGDQMYSFSITAEALAISFAQEDQVFFAALRSNHVVSYSLADGNEIDKCLWQDDWEDEHVGEQILPTIAAFNQDGSVLAIVYRGRSISLWDIEERYAMGRLVRNLALESSGSGGGYRRQVSANASCEAVVFNTSMHLLAAVYQDSELCVFDTETRELEKQIDAEATALACSPDGHTLACGELNGSVQLRNFATLELLHKISTWDDAITSLAFSTDGLRFLDVRGSFCNVWEPAILISSSNDDARSEVYSEAIHDAAKTVESKDSEEIIKITALAIMGKGDYVFVGNEEGAVLFYDVVKAQKKHILYSHAPFTSITLLEWHQEQSILISSDTSSRFIVSKLVADSSDKWSCQPLFDHRLGDSKVLKQLILAPQADRFLVSSWPLEMVWSTTGQEGGSYNEWEQGNYWINHPRKPSSLVAVSKSITTFFEWQGLKRTMIRTNSKTSSADDSTAGVKRIIVCPRAQHLVIAMESTERRKRITRLIVTRFASLDAPHESPLALEELSELEGRVEYLVGAFDTKIVFLDRNLWICSLDLMTFKKNKSYIRHFFIPLEWISSSGDPLLLINANKDLIFAKNDEITVIKKGFSGIAEVVALDKPRTGKEFHTDKP